MITVVTERKMPLNGTDQPDEHEPCSIHNNPELIATVRDGDEQAIPPFLCFVSGHEDMKRKYTSLRRLWTDFEFPPPIEGVVFPVETYPCKWDVNR